MVNPKYSNKSHWGFFSGINASLFINFTLIEHCQNCNTAKSDDTTKKSDMLSSTIAWNFSTILILYGTYTHRKSKAIFYCL